MRGNPLIFWSWEVLPTNYPLEEWIVTLLYPVFPFTFPLDSVSLSMGGRYFIPNGTSSMPVFQVVTLWDVAWAVTLLLEMLGACSWPCCWKLNPSDVYLLGLWWAPGYKAPKRALWAWRQLLPKLCLLVGTKKLLSNMEKPKSKLLSWCLYSWRLAVWCWGPYAAICWCCAQPGSSKKASACWSDPPSSALWIGATERTWLWLKHYKLKVGLNCLLLD